MNTLNPTMNGKSEQNSAHVILCNAEGGEQPEDISPDQQARGAGQVYSLDPQARGKEYKPAERSASRGG